MKAKNKVHKIVADGELWYYQLGVTWCSVNGPVVAIGQEAAGHSNGKKYEPDRVIPKFCIDFQSITPLQVLIAIDAYKSGLEDGTKMGIENCIEVLKNI